MFSLVLFLGGGTMIRQSYLVVLLGGRNIPCHSQTDEESVLVRCLFWQMHEYPCRASHEKIQNNEKASQIGRILRHSRVLASPHLFCPVDDYAGSTVHPSKS